MPKSENRKRLSLYIDDGMDFYLRSLKEAYEEECWAPTGMGFNSFVVLLIGAGADKLTDIVRELQDI